ncbi:MAG: chemotaxis protein CheW [Nitrospirota bacterium]
MKRSGGRVSKRGGASSQRTAKGKREPAPISAARVDGESRVAAAATPAAPDEGHSEILSAVLPSDAPGVGGSAAPPSEAPAPVVADSNALPQAEGAPQRAPLSAEGAPGAQSSRVEEFLGFRLDREEYCVWIRLIKEIIRPPEITPIPRSPADILGLISLRGTIVPIFNIRRRLGLPTGELGPKARIVVVMLDAGPVGLVVDHVTEVISVDPGALEPPPPTMGEQEASLVTATVRLHDRIVGVLHLERLVAIEPQASLRAAA